MAALLKALAIMAAAPKPLDDITTVSAWVAATWQVGAAAVMVSVAFLHTSGTVNQVALGLKWAKEMRWVVRCSEGDRRWK